MRKVFMMTVLALAVSGCASQQSNTPQVRDLSRSGANASSPAKPFTDVPASKEVGRLAAACVPPDQSAAKLKRKLLHFVPPATAGGRPGCLQETPICVALRSTRPPWWL